MKVRQDFLHKHRIPEEESVVLVATDLTQLAQSSLLYCATENALLPKTSRFRTCQCLPSWTKRRRK